MVRIILKFCYNTMYNKNSTWFCFKIKSIIDNYNFGRRCNGKIFVGEKNQRTSEL
jgi:hypothetical protein